VASLCFHRSGCGIRAPALVPWTCPVTPCAGYVRDSDGSTTSGRGAHHGVAEPLNAMPGVLSAGHRSGSPMREWNRAPARVLIAVPPAPRASGPSSCPARGRCRNLDESLALVLWRRGCGGQYGARDAPVLPRVPGHRHVQQRTHMPIGDWLMGDLRDAAGRDLVEVPVVRVASMAQPPHGAAPDPGSACRCTVSGAVLLPSSADCHSSHHAWTRPARVGGPAGRVRFLCYLQSTTDRQRVLTCRWASVAQSTRAVSPIRCEEGSTDD
jgi:hypothetical protein